MWEKNPKINFCHSREGGNPENIKKPENDFLSYPRLSRV